VIIPLSFKETKRKVIFPFACVIALDPGENIASKTRLCINFWKTKSGGYLIGEGVIGIEDTAPMILMRGAFPELVSVLLMDHRELNLLLKTPANSKPYTMIKNWQEGDLEFVPKIKGEEIRAITDGKLGPMTLLKIMLDWKSLQRLNRYDLVHKLFPFTNGFNENQLNKIVYRLDHLYRNFGLIGKPANYFEPQRHELLDCIEIALKVHLSLHAPPTPTEVESS